MGMLPLLVARFCEMKGPKSRVHLASSKKEATCTMRSLLCKWYDLLRIEFLHNSLQNYSMGRSFEGNGNLTSVFGWFRRQSSKAKLFVTDIAMAIHEDGTTETASHETQKDLLLSWCNLHRKVRLTWIGRLAQPP